MIRTTLLLGCIALSPTTVILNAQPTTLSAQSPAPNPGTGPVSHDIRSQLLQISDLQEIAGRVPVRYVPGARDRAIEYQKSFEPAHAWFEEQLKVHVPMEMYVLDQKAWDKIENRAPWPIPYSHSAPNVIVLSDRVEELVGQEHGAKLPGEYIPYHEAGHIFASAIGLESGNPWVNELVANMFMAAYIHVKRPDLDWALGGPEAHGMNEVPRFTSLRDLDYVYAPGVGAKNYVWFEHHLERLASFLVAKQDFGKVIKEMKMQFPKAAEKQESLDQIVAHLDRVRPGARDFLGPLYGPSKLARIVAVTCPPYAPVTKAQSTVIAVQNDSGHPLTVISPNGTAETLEATRWNGFSVPVGESLKLPNGSCLIATEEPTLAVISKQ